MLEPGANWNGVISDGRPVALAVAPGQCLTQIAGWDDFAARASDVLRPLGVEFPESYARAQTAGEMHAWRISPDRILLRSGTPPQLDTDADLAVLDLSHAKLEVTVSGAGAAGLLARVTAIDFSQKAFPAGNFVQAPIHGVGVLLERTGPEVFVLLVPTSWARSVVEFLVAHIHEGETAR